MRPTVDVAVSERPIRTDDAASLERWVNREAVPFLSKARKGLNAKGTERPEPVTSDGAGTYATLWTSPEMPQDAVWLIEAYIGGFVAGVQASYVLATTITSIAGVVAPLGGTTVVHLQESDALCDARFAYDTVTRTVIVEARDNASAAMQWTCVVVTHEGLPVQT